jgi:hypothetical protein
MSVAPDPNTQSNSPEDLNFLQLLHDKLKIRQRFKHGLLPYISQRGTAVAQWLRYCATNQKVAVSIPDGVIGIFH